MVLVAASIPTQSFAQFAIVHDPANAVHLIQSVSHQVTQIANQAITIKNQALQIKQGAANLSTYSNVGQWSDLSARLLSLEGVVQSAARRHAISGDVADAQIQRMQQEIATLRGLERLANGSSGALQAETASARLEAELVAQLQEQRQLSLAQIKQQQLAEQEALNRYHGPATRPDQY